MRFILPGHSTVSKPALQLHITLPCKSYDVIAFVQTSISKLSFNAKTAVAGEENVGHVTKWQMG